MFVIEKVESLAPDMKLFRILISKSEYQPGQFAQLSVLGVGEVPISIASSPTQKGCLEFLVRKVGKVTSAIHALKKGDKIGIRGPYGNNFPLEEAQGKEIIFLSGGCGLAPLRSLIRYCLDKRDKYGDITILYGARTEKEIIFKKEIDSWKKLPGIKVYISLEKGPAPGDFTIGVVTALFDRLRNLENKKIFMCGSPLMVRFAAGGLLKLGATNENIFVSLERYMKCGVGKCGHCYVGGKYVCTDGPVFSYREARRLGVEG